jgi:hypothetical protein
MSFAIKVPSMFKKNAESKPAIYDTFLSPAYQQHNVARLRHLESLDLPLSNKKVIEFGAGIGDFTFYYLIKNCDILPTEGRAALCEFIGKRFNIECRLIDAEKDFEKIKALPYADIVHCYGLLYHISNPEEFLTAISAKGEMLLLETCVSDDTRPEGIHLVSEDASDNTQALSGKGCRPSRSWIYKTLKKLYPYVYLPLTQPKHPDFPTDWSQPVDTTRQNIRAIFIASTKEIKSEKLTSELIKKLSV